MIEYENLHRLNQPFLSELRLAFDNLLRNGTFILGKQVREFEKEFADYCGVSHCIGVGSGLDALTLALRCFDFKEGSEVIVPSNTYIASILAIINCGLKPVLVEPEIGTYNIDPNLLEDAITSKTAAIMAVHLYGKCCQMDEILTIRQKYNLRLVEDCAHAHGATYKGKKAGTFGDFGAYSFYPTKNLGALGDAGCLITEDSELALRVRALRNYGSLIRDEHDIIGVNSRLDEIQAGFLRIKLKALNQLNQRRRKNAALYDKSLDMQFIKPSINSDFLDVFHIYNIRHPQRKRLREYLLANGVDTRVHYPTPPHKQRALRHLFKFTSFPISEEIHLTTLSLPISPIHTENEILKIIEVLQAFIRV